MAAEVHAWLRRHWLPLTLAALYAVLFSILSILRHLTFHTQTFDLGVFEQAFWYTLRGRFMYNNFEGINHFAAHFSPIYLLLLPFYSLMPGPAILLILQAAALGSSVIPLYWLTQRRCGQAAAIFVSISFLLFPSLHWLNLYDFHQVAFAVPAFLWALERLDRGRRVAAAACLALAAATVEGMILMTAALGVYLAIFVKPSRRFGLAVAAAALTYFWLVGGVFMPSLGGDVNRFLKERFPPELGGSLPGFARTIVQRPQLVLATVSQPEKLLYLGKLFSPLAGLPLVAWPQLTLLLPGLAQNLLANYPPQFSGQFQYDAMLIPFIFFAAIAAWARVRRWPNARIFPSVVLGASLAAFLWWSPLGLRAYPWAQFRFDDRAAALARIRDAIPPDAAVALPTSLVPHLTHREGVWLVHAEPLGVPDLIVVDLWEPAEFSSPEALGEYLKYYLNQAGYRSRVWRQRMLVLSRPGYPAPLWAEP